MLLWAGHRLPPDYLEELRIEVDVTPTSITILECRPPWDSGRGGFEWTRAPIARLRYNKSKKTWKLYWRDRSRKFHLYDRVDATESIEMLLDEIDRDPTGIFWG